MKRSLAKRPDMRALSYPEPRQHCNFLWSIRTGNNTGAEANKDAKGQAAHTRVPEPPFLSVIRQMGEGVHRVCTFWDVVLL